MYQKTPVCESSAVQIEQEGRRLVLLTDMFKCDSRASSWPRIGLETLVSCLNGAKAAL